tara:strand:- start:490 stop:648 length:159 start_codon:yes stop_codon:yes gene_type:complete
MNGLRARNMRFCSIHISFLNKLTAQNPFGDPKDLVKSYDDLSGSFENGIIFE